MADQRVPLDSQEILLRELQREDLSIYTVVRMAKADALAGNFSSAVARLRVDSDKIRMYSEDLYKIINI